MYSVLTVYVLSKTMKNIEIFVSSSFYSIKIVVNAKTCLRNAQNNLHMHIVKSATQ